MKAIIQICEDLKLNIGAGVTLLDGNHIHAIPRDMNGTLLLGPVVLSEVQGALLEYFGGLTVVTVAFVEAADITYQQATIDTLLTISPTSTSITYIILSVSDTVAARHFNIKPLIDVMAVLRSPNGCPWDKSQTHSSLRRYFIEEVYEVMEAIDNEDMDNLCEELGDVLLQIVFHARVAEEHGFFSMQDIINGIVEKMKRRHPHVFKIDSQGKLGTKRLSWDEIKATEKGNSKKKLLDGISKGLPALLRAQKLQEKAAKVGFDWVSVEPMWAKLYEEIDEFKAELMQENIKNAELEGGDILFSLINLFRWYKISGENALSRTNNKFEQRFAYVEALVENSGRSWNEFSLDELDTFWCAAKLQEVANSH